LSRPGEQELHVFICTTSTLPEEPEDGRHICVQAVTPETILLINNRCRSFYAAGTAHLAANGFNIEFLFNLQNFCPSRFQPRSLREDSLIVTLCGIIFQAEPKDIPHNNQTSIFLVRVDELLTVRLLFSLSVTFTNSFAL
jgi:hypothetical protein